METARAQFVRAVKANDVQLATELLRSGNETILERLRIAGDLLEHAAEKGHMEIFRFLLESGAPIHEEPTDPFVRICGTNNLEAVTLMIEKGAVLNVELGGDLLSVPLRSAVAGGHLDVVKTLVHAGAAVNGIWNNRTNLSLAIDEGLVEIADYLRSKGAKLPLELSQHSSDANPSSISTETIEQFSLHFGRPNENALHSLLGGQPPVAIHVIPVNPNCEYNTLFTVGLAERPMTVPEGRDEWSRAELYIQLPKDWQLDRSDDPNWGWPNRWLHEVSQLPARNQTWYGGRLCVIELNGLVPGSRFQGCLLWAQHFFEARSLSGQIVNLYRVIPLTAAELTFEKQHGIENLLNAMSLVDVPFHVAMDRREAVHGLTSP